MPVKQTDLATKIQKELVDRNYFNDVKYNLASKSRWKIIGDLSEAFSQVFTATATILAFASGFFEYSFLAFIAGCIGTSAIVLKQFSSYCMKESSERTQQVNRILKKLGLNEIPDIIDDRFPEVNRIQRVNRLSDVVEV